MVVVAETLHGSPLNGEGLGVPYSSGGGGIPTSSNKVGMPTIPFSLSLSVLPEVGPGHGHSHRNVWPGWGGGLTKTSLSS